MPHSPSARPLLFRGALALVAVVVSIMVVRVVDRPAPEGGAARSPVDPEEVAVAVLREWDQRRAAAYARGDVGALAALYAEGSRAGSRDVRLLREYVARGLVVEGMQQQLLRVELLDAAPHRLQVRVRDRVAGATAVSAGGRLRLPGDRPTTRRLTLVRQHGDWRVWSVDPGR